MPDRTFHFHDATLIISSQAPGGVQSRRGGFDVDWETFNRIIAALAAAGFAVGGDGRIDAAWPVLSKWHRAGWRQTPAGPLHFAAEVYPSGCKVEFWQDEVTVNHNGGRYDFDRREKMPYLISKAFEAVQRRLWVHLTGRGFTEIERIASPNPDPLAYFNDRWDGEYERRRGTHRFRRGDDGWPIAAELGLTCWGVTAERPLIEQGSTWYFRDHHGQLMRGRCYGGINGMWTVVYGPGARDFTARHRGELFQCSPSATARRLHPQGRKRLAAALTAAVTIENFERAIVLRDVMKRAA